MGPLADVAAGNLHAFPASSQRDSLLVKLALARSILRKTTVAIGGIFTPMLTEPPQAPPSHATTNRNRPGQDGPNPGHRRDPAPARYQRCLPSGSVATRQKHGSHRTYGDDVAAFAPFIGVRAVAVTANGRGALSASHHSLDGCAAGTQWPRPED